MMYPLGSRVADTGTSQLSMRSDDSSQVLGMAFVIALPSS
jgi:hypothetical protein